MHAAAFAGNHELLKLMRLWEVPLDAQCHKSMTALHFAAIGRSMTVCRQLLDWKLRLDLLDSSKKSPLEYCTGLV